MKPARRKPKRKALRRVRHKMHAKRKRNPVRKPSPLGDAIRAARAARGLTQLALAHAIGYTGDDAGAYICRIEAGQQAPRLEMIQRIASALGITTWALLPP